jgi:hypothetical protein
MYVPGGTRSTLRMNTLAKLQERRTHDLRPSDGKARTGISNEYMYNVMHGTVALLYSSQRHVVLHVVETLLAMCTYN